MGYSLDKFLKPLREVDKTIRVFDDRGLPVHTINPFAVLRVFASANNCNVSLSGNRTIVLDFSNPEETKEAVLKFQSYVDILRGRVPSVIDKGTEQYVQNIINNFGVKSINGLTHSEQFISAQGDDNLSLILVSQGQTHSISLTFSGVLPVSRGGLGSSTFTTGELLIYDGTSIISSGYIINDLGTGNTDIWTADKIINNISGSASTFKYKEKPVGNLDGVNSEFVLNDTPVEDSEHVYLNGMLQDPEDDYTIVGNKIIFNEAPPEHSKIICSYQTN